MLLERLRRRMIAVVEAVDAFIQQQLMDCGPDDNARDATFGCHLVARSCEALSFLPGSVLLRGWPVGKKPLILVEPFLPRAEMNCRAWSLSTRGAIRCGPLPGLG